MNWRPWHRKLEQSEAKLREAERLRDDAQRQQQRVQAIVPRVDELSASLRRLHQENHIGPLIESVLRGSE